MATVIWRGDADAVAQISTATPASVEISDVFTLTCGGSSVSFTATAATVADVTAGITTAWNASTAPEMAEITATDSTTTVTLTHDTAGVEFTVTATEVDGGGTDDQTFTMATPTAAAGPHVWSTDSNWSTGSVPADDDHIIIEESDVDILYGLGQSGITADSLTIKASYTGEIGLEETNSDGTTSYTEYRDTFLEIEPDKIDIGAGDGNGSAMIKINTGSVATAVTVMKTASATETNCGAVQWKGTNAGNTLTVQRGDVGVATQGGETATIATLAVSYSTSVSNDASVVCGSGVTLTTINQFGSTLEINSAAVTCNVSAGTLTVNGTSTITTATVEGGTLYHQSSGTITTLVVSASGTIDFSRDAKTRTVINTSVYTGAAIRDPHKTVTWTNGIDGVHCDPMNEAILQLGKNYTVTPSAI